MVERLVLLRIIDSLWVEHLTEIDDMRRGIGLRGYAGSDPLNEFKVEAFGLFDELRGFIRHQVAHTIFRVQVQRGSPGGDPAARAGPARRDGRPRARTAERRPAADGDRSTSDQRRLRGRDQRRCGGSVGPRAPRDDRPPPPVRPPRVPGLGGNGPRVMREQLGDEVRSPSGGASAPGAKLGRNDPCYCGSGLKYKKCHGR